MMMQTYSVGKFTARILKRWKIHCLHIKAGFQFGFFHLLCLHRPLPTTQTRLSVAEQTKTTSPKKGRVKQNSKNQFQYPVKKYAFPLPPSPFPPFPLPSI